MMKSISAMIGISALIFLFASCKKEKEAPEGNDNELITTIEVILTERGTGIDSVYIWEDADGPGGDVPFIEHINLKENKIYDAEIKFWDKSRTPAENITLEVQQESLNHRVYFEASSGSGITISDLDTDSDGKPLGISSVWSTTSSATGTLTIVLRHYPDGGKETDDPVNSTKSSTDAGAIFNVNVGT